MCRAARQTADGKPLRCKECNEPVKRRERQNLANAVKREQAKVDAELKEKETEETLPETESETPVAEEHDSAPEDTSEDEETSTSSPSEESTDGGIPESESDPAEYEIAESAVDEKVEPTTLAEAVARDAKAMGLEEFDEEAIADKVASMMAEPEVARQLAESVRATREKAEDNKAWILDGREDTPENIAAGVAERQQEILLVGTVVAERAQAIHCVNLEEAREEWQQRTLDARKAYEDSLPAQVDTAKAFIDRRKALIEKYSSTIYSYENQITPEEQAEMDALREANNATLEARENARRNLEKALRGEDEVTLAVLGKIADANKQAIAEVRPVGNVPVAFTEKIRGGDAGESFREAIQSTFPDDWVKSSNELGELSLERVTKASGRAHYSPVRQKASVYSYIFKGRPEEGDDRFIGWQERKDEEGNPTGIWEGPARDFLTERSPWNYKKFNGDKPKGAGWKRGVAVQNGKRIPGWVRENPTDAKRLAAGSASKAVITVNMKEGEKERLQTMQHEFSHRVEDANPHITMLEEGFLASRTTMESGRREPMQRYGSSRSKERVRPDNFVNPYIGKEYESRMREVLSMGSESVFGGAEGGLVGIGHKSTDLEMRNWILGMYATA